MFLSILLAVLVAEAIVALISVGTRAYITGRWTEAGRISAVMANLHQLDNQMRTLTTTQEQIKAQISNEVSDRQWRLSQKRDLYTKLLDVTEGIAHLYMEIQFEGEMDEAEDKIARQKMLDATLDLRRLAALAKIFGNEDCYKALKEYFSATSQESTKNWAEKAEEKANTLSGKLIRAAKREFGLES